MQTKKEYKKEFAKTMYLYFASYDDSFGAPSFSKFARKSGLTRDDIERFKEHEEFKRAYNECIEIRRDYLIDHALSKRFDSSLVKYLLSEEFPAPSDDGTVEFTLRVVNDHNEN